jgi:hypothetical protein
MAADVDFIAFVAERERRCSGSCRPRLLEDRAVDETADR